MGYRLTSTGLQNRYRYENRNNYEGELVHNQVDWL